MQHQAKTADQSVSPLAPVLQAIMKRKKWIALLLAPIWLYLIFVAVCAIYLASSSKVVELRDSVGCYARINHAGGEAASYGILGCAEIVPADGTFRFKVRLLRIAPDGLIAEGVTSVTFHFWQLDAVEVVKTRDGPFAF